MSSRLLLNGSNRLSAFVVRFLTRRFIGDYDPQSERVYSMNTVLDHDQVAVEVLDSAGHHLEDGHQSEFESKIRWADSFVLMYSVTDKCSFDECSRLLFLIGYNKRRRRHLFGNTFGNGSSGGRGVEQCKSSVSVILVGNKIDQADDRMVTYEEGERRSRELGCDQFCEISVREQVDVPRNVIEQLYAHWKHGHHAHFVQKSRTSPVTAESGHFGRRCLDTLSRCGNGTTPSHSKSSSMDVINEREDASNNHCALLLGSPTLLEDDGPQYAESAFRSRASTDGSLKYRKRPEKSSSQPVSPPVATDPDQLTFNSSGRRPLRRMSISLRGTNNV